ncbi:MAG: class F sortase [Dehalococcoidia bacterium]
MQTRIAIIAIAGILVGLGIGFFFVNQSSDSTNEQSSNISTQVNTIAMPTSVVVNPPVVATAQITPTPNTPILVTPTVAAPVAIPTATATPEPTATPDPASKLVTNIADLVDEFGYPPNTDFAVLRIPSLNVSARVGEKIVSRSSATMPTPQGPADVVWYNMSEWPGLGGRPGEGGNAIFAGHVDYAAYVKHAQVNYFGMAVFGSVSRLTIGDIIEVDYEGNTYTYRVRWTRQYDADYNQWGSVWSDEVSVDSITLYTCGGEFDRTTRSYSDRFVVRAERI